MAPGDEVAQEFARNNFCKEFPAPLSRTYGNQPIEKVLIFLLYIKSCDQTRKSISLISFKRSQNSEESFLFYLLFHGNHIIRRDLIFPNINGAFHEVYQSLL